MKLEDLQNKLLQFRRSGPLFLQGGDTGQASSPSNIALIKYWGKEPHPDHKGEFLQTPTNSSISLTLDNLRTSTRVVVRGRFEDPPEMGTRLGGHRFLLHKTWEDFQRIFPRPDVPLAEGLLAKFLDALLHPWADDISLQVESFNGFPTACGVASSASGYGALVLAVADLIPMKKIFTPVEQKFWIEQWARLGSGSAIRSVVPKKPKDRSKSQWVAWVRDSATESHAAEVGCHKVFHHIQHLLCIVAKDPKPQSSREGHRWAHTSPFFSWRLAGFPRLWDDCLQALKKGDFKTLQRISETDACHLHAMMMTGDNPVKLVNTGTNQVISHFVRARDQANACALWTLDAGPNVHILYLPSAENFIQGFKQQLLEIKGLNVSFLNG